MKMSQQMSFFRRAASAETLQQNEVNGGGKRQSPVSSSVVVVRMSPCLPALMFRCFIIPRKRQRPRMKQKRRRDSGDSLPIFSLLFSPLIFLATIFLFFFLIRITIEECSKRSEKIEREERELKAAGQPAEAFSVQSTEEEEEGEGTERHLGRHCY